ncbi:hypothetical protein TWF225_006711 [Orbilia oligospora]|uniref:cellulase n=1 Tax=Orbilia oligospora TaxID=2813651 RepID=A0A7C8K3J4_ORBOL|nr:hypothetical protein TWF751_010610 [Orbilia oligospora]KAF3181156.1 hypothetical protein TWF225_006711 [Orbilia oligospora]KAF3245342.1 hypothetical protein TWF217_010478 [Orbilia oligospora]KAF3270189.1 hypothetical protein TWF128_004005 [Orbilia oligospora]KAF3287842.1 hypothetical protein TWF132_008224 [Orbilia oligospora]
MAVLRALLLLATVTRVLANAKYTGTGSTGLYWDCCKPSCSWTEKGPWLTHPVQTCKKDDSPLNDFTVGSACGQGGTAFVCNNQQPWAVNDTFSYAFTSTFIPGASEFDWCCSCYELTFLNGGLEGKRMIVQASNTGYDDPKRTIFGVGAPGEKDYANGCMDRYNSDGGGFLGKEGRPLTKRSDCESLPKQLQQGCFWRFDWFLDAFKPNMTFQRVKCPKALTDITGCIRDDEDKFNASAGGKTNTASTPRGDSFGLLATSLVLAAFAFAFNV